MRISNLVRRTENTVLGYTKSVRREFMARATLAELKRQARATQLDSIKAMIDAGQLDELRELTKAFADAMEDIK